MGKKLGKPTAFFLVIIVRKQDLSLSFPRHFYTQNPACMKKFFKALLYIVGTVVVLAGIAATYISFRSIPKFTPEKKDIKVIATPERVEQGTKLASMLCKNCHYNEQTGKFTGRELTEIPMFGKIFSKNITQDGNAGIAGWTDGELAYLIRTGISKDGQYVPPYMPKLAHIADEDLYSIIAFLRSGNAWVQADNSRQPASEPGFLTKFLVTIGQAKPFPYPAHTIERPDTANKVQWGKYIAVAQLECFACHSKDFATDNFLEPEKSVGFFGGGNKMIDSKGHEIHTLNITMDEKTGIGQWSEDDFVKAVRFGQLPGSQPPLREPMQPYANLTESEVKAIYAYLKTIPVITNKVNRTFYE
jgi:cytochrome c2